MRQPGGEPTGDQSTTGDRVASAITAFEGHSFWPDDVARVTAGLRDPTLITSNRDVTDAHLLAIVERYAGTLVTFDSRIGRLPGTRNPSLLSAKP